MTTDQNHLTLPTNLREAADDLPRLSSSEEYWRFRNLYTWAADRIDTLEIEAANNAASVQAADARAVIAGDPQRFLAEIEKAWRHRHARLGIHGRYDGPEPQAVHEMFQRMMADENAMQAERAELAQFILLNFGERKVSPAAAFKLEPGCELEPGVTIAKLAIDRLKLALDRGAFRIAGETFPLASNLREAATANPALADLLSRAADAIEVAMQHADEAEAITMAKAIEIDRLTIDRDHYRSEATGATAQRIESLETSLAQEQGSNAQDRFELTEEIKRLTALTQSLRAAGEHSEVKFMAAVERAGALEALLAEIDAAADEPSARGFRSKIREIASRRSLVPEGIDQREADIALSKEVEQQALTQLVVEAGALMFCGERDPVAIAGKALLGLFRSLDREDLLDDIDESLPGYIADIAARVDPEDIDGDDGE